MTSGRRHPFPLPVRWRRCLRLWVRMASPLAVVLLFHGGGSCRVASWRTGTMISRRSGGGTHQIRRAASPSVPTRTRRATERRLAASDPFVSTSRTGRLSSSPLRKGSCSVAASFRGSTVLSTAVGNYLSTENATIANATTTTAPNGFPTATIHRLPEIQRVYGISDLHVDNGENMKWLEAKCEQQKPQQQPQGHDAPFHAGGWDETDLIVVAGDISHDRNKIEHVLDLLVQTGAKVVFVPGNHEAWLTSQQKQQLQIQQEQQEQQEQDSYSSIAKLEDIENLCRQLGVYTTGDCLCVGGGCSEEDDGDGDDAVTEELWILPLDSWYDGSLSFVGLSVDAPNYDFVSDFGKWPWVDFQQCHWPSFLYRETAQGEAEAEAETEAETETGQSSSRLLRKIPAGLVDYYLARNQPVLDAFHKATRQDTPTMNPASTSRTRKRHVSVMTVTHFLPNQQSLPDWKDLESSTFDFDSWLDHGAGGMSAKFALVGGSDKIDAQIRSLSVCRDKENGNNDGNQNTSEDNDGFYHQIHVFGHSHRPKDFVYKGIRYVHNPLGKPREREMYMCDPEVDTKLLWEANNSDSDGNSNPSNETIIRYWEERGGGLEMLQKRMQANRRNRKLFLKKRKLRQQQQQQEQQQT